MLVAISFSCKGKKDTTIKAIDFSNYTIEEVLDWALENDATSKFEFEYNFESEEDAGNVIGQSVSDGMPIDKTICITISSKGIVGSLGTESIRVPNVIGLNIKDATNKLESLGFEVTTKYVESKKNKDIVLSSDPLPGVNALQNSKIQLTVSSKKSCLEINLELPKEKDDTMIKVYVDGILDRTKTVYVTPSTKSKVFSFSGLDEVKEVSFKLNDKDYATYTLDFSKGTVTKK